MFAYTKRTGIIGKLDSRTVQLAVDRLYRDMDMVFTDGTYKDGSEPLICFEKSPCMEAESWTIEISKDRMAVKAADDLGIVYAFAEISRRFLGILPFWFWMDCRPERKETVWVDEQHIASHRAAIRYRGWFFNDETFLARWNPGGDETLAWEMGFEACLRCGGNMVIPGDVDNFRKYRKLASDMGLILTHHHVEILGAPMFLNVYPEKKPSYRENGALFEKLWEDAVREQAGERTVYAVGFRGQGDCAFWESEGTGADMTDQEKGAFISGIIRKQAALVRKYVKDAVLCTNLYGELMELYREGCLDIPEDIIKIWADNGYGRMVARRRDNHNPRTPALPAGADERKGKHGIYYHVSFYDLQAASHTTMLPQPPEYFDRQLWEAFENGLTEYLIVNCSSLRQHVCTLDMISRIWNGEHIDSAGFYSDFAGRYFKNGSLRIAKLYEEYPMHCIRYGIQEDETAGEQFYTHCVRILAGQWMKEWQRPAQALDWAVKADSLASQVAWLQEKCAGKEREFSDYAERCEAEGERLYGVLTLQVILHREGCAGVGHFCKAWHLWEQHDYMEAFYECGLAAEHFSEGHEALLRAETGIWKGFYQFERFADYKFAAHILRCLMSYIRIYDDSPSYYRWDARLRRLCGKGEIFSNWDNHETEAELFGRMKAIRGKTLKNELIVWRRI